MIKHYMILSLLYVSAFSLNIKPIFPILNNIFKLDKICNNINNTTLLSTYSENEIMLMINFLI